MHCWDGRWKSWSDLNLVVLICLVSRSPSKRRELRLVQCTKSRSKDAWTVFGFCKYFYVIPIVLLHVCLWNRSPMQLFYLIPSTFCQPVSFPVQISLVEWWQCGALRFHLRCGNSNISQALMSCWACWLTPPPISTQIFPYRETRPGCVVSLGLVLQRRLSHRVSQRQITGW